MQLRQLLKNSSKEVGKNLNWAHFRYILSPAGSLPGSGINGARGPGTQINGPSRSPLFLQPWGALLQDS